MAAAVARRVRTSQPQQNVQIDWNNPIASGLVFAYTMSNEAQGWGEDGRSSIPYVKTSDGTTVFGQRINTATGTAGQVLSGASYLFGQQSQTSVKSGVYSLFAFGTASTGNVQSAIDDDDGTARRFQFRINSSKVEFIPFYSGGNGSVAASGTLSLADQVNGFAMGATANGTSYAVYQKGAKTSATMAGTALTPNSTINIGARKTAVQQWLNGGLMLVAMWNRPLTDAEHQSLADNPWQLFKATPRRLTLAWSASSSTSGNATVTGVQVASAVGTVAGSGGAATSVTGVQAATAAGSITATAGGNATVTGVQAASAVASATATGGASTSLAGVQSTLTVTGITATGGASASVTGVSAATAVGNVTASAAGSATATVTGVSSAIAAGNVTATGGASTATGGITASAATGTVSASGAALGIIAGLQVSCEIGAIVATGTAGSVTAYLQEVAAATAVGNVSAVGTRSTIEVNVTEDMICSVVRSYIKSVAPDRPVRRTPVNRASMPNVPYVAFTPGLRRQLSTNVSSDDANSRTVRRSEQMSFQIDCYGAGSSELADTLNILYRDHYAAELFANSGLDIAPLYAGDIQQAPYVNGEDQYEDRYTFEIELQINPSVTVPLQSCNILHIDRVPVDVIFPPTEE